jgi:hypothetical protein
MLLGRQTPDRPSKKGARLPAGLIHCTYKGPTSDFFMKISTSKKLLVSYIVEKLMTSAFQQAKRKLGEWIFFYSL